MPKAWLIQTNFAGGESSPLLYGRTDIPRYQASAATIKNCYCMSKGGARRRPGSRFVYNSGSNVVNRLIPFSVMNKDVTPMEQQGYIIEIRNDGKMRFYTEGALITSGGSPVEITHPYGSTDIPSIAYEVFEGSLYLCSHSYPPRRLTRTSDTSWQLEQLNFSTTPGIPIESLTSSVTTATADLGDTKHKLSTGDSVTISGAQEANYNGTFTITKVDKYIFTYTIVATTSPATGSIVMVPTVKKASSDGTTVTIITAREHDLLSGQMVAVSGANESEYNVTAKITVSGKKTFSYKPETPPGAGTATGTITYQRVLFDATTGYPGAITFYQQRMFMAATREKPTTVWASKSGDIFDFITGTADNDAMELTLADAKSMIMHLASHKLIGIMTADKEFTLQGSSDKALSPTNLQIKGRSIYGASGARPVTLGEEILFITSHKIKLRTLQYQFETDSYKSPDMSIIASHLAELGMEDMAYSIEPESLVWIVTTDGKLLSVTVDRDQEIVSWSWHETEGLVKGITVIKADNTDQIWLIVERTINGTAYRYIEYLDASLNTDAASTQTSSSEQTTWTGLEHLEGMTVDIVADDVVMPQQTVTAGQIELPRGAMAVQIGLHYESIVEDLPPEFQTGQGSAQAQAISISTIVARLHETIGCEINGDVIPFRKFGAGILDQDVQPFTGDKRVSNIGWGARNGRKPGTVTIMQRQPLPFTLLAIIKEVTAN